MHESFSAKKVKSSQKAVTTSTCPKTCPQASAVSIRSLQLIQEHRKETIGKSIVVYYFQNC